MMKKRVLLIILVLSSLLIFGCESYFGEPVGQNIEVTTPTSSLTAEEKESKLLQKMDADGDGFIGQGDLDKFTIAFQSGQYDAGYDYDNYGTGDGDIDYDDFFILTEHFGYFAKRTLYVKSAECDDSDNTFIKGMKSDLSLILGEDVYVKGYVKHKNELDYDYCGDWVSYKDFWGDGIGKFKKANTSINNSTCL